MHFESLKTQMMRGDLFDVVKVNAAPVAGVVASHGFNLSDAADLAAIIAMIVSVAYTLWKWRIGVKRNKVIDTVSGDEP